MAPVYGIQGVGSTVWGIGSSPQEADRIRECGEHSRDPMLRGLNF